MTKKLHYNLGDLQEIIRQLSSTAHIWVPQMFPLGKRNGQDWRIGDLDGAKGMSTSIRLTGEKAGCFIDHANSDIIGGGPIELIRLTYNLTFADAIQKALDISRIPLPKYSEPVKTEKEKVERDLYKDLRGYEVQAYDESKRLIDEQAKKYKDLKVDQNVIDKWKTEEYRKAEYKKAEYSKDFFEGVRAESNKLATEQKSWAGLCDWMMEECLIEMDNGCSK